MQHSVAGQGFLIIEALPSHSDTPHSVGLHWTSDQTDTQTSSWQHTKLTTNIYAPGWIRTRNPSQWAATDPALDREATRIGSEPITIMKIPVKKFKTYFQFILTAFKTN